MLKMWLKTARSRLKEYVVFFLCVTGAVTLYYGFSAIQRNFNLVQRLSRDVRTDMLLSLANLGVVFLLFTFLLLALPFFLVSQQKDFKIFLALGVQRSQLIFYSFLENSLLLTAAFVTGTVVGIFLSKLLGQILVHLMGLTLTIHYLFSWPTIVALAWLLLVLDLIVALRNSWSIWRIKGELSGRGLKKVHPWWQATLGVLGVGALLVGYGLALRLSWLINLANDHPDLTLLALFLPLIIFGSCLVGTFLIVRQLLPFILNVLSNKATFYYRGLRLMIVGNLNGQFRSTGNTLALVAILMGIALSLMGGAGSLYAIDHQYLQQETSMDYQVAGEEQADFVQLLAEHHLTLKTTLTTTFKATGAQYHIRFGQEKEQTSHLVSLLSLSSYQALSQVNTNLPEIQTLAPNEVVFLKSQGIPFGAERLASSALTLLGGTPLVISTQLTDNLGNKELRYNQPTLVVSDAVWEKAPGVAYQVASSTLGKNSSQQAAMGEKVADSFQTKWTDPLVVDLQNIETGSVTRAEGQTTNLQQPLVYRTNFGSRFLTRRSFKATSGILIYLTGFLGLIFFIATGSIIMLRQLGLAKNQRETYQTLKLLGVAEASIKKSVFFTNALIFLLPVVLGAVHAFFALNIYYQFVVFLPETVSLSLWGSGLVVYILLYWLTSVHAYRWQKK